MMRRVPGHRTDVLDGTPMVTVGQEDAVGDALGRRRPWSCSCPWAAGRPVDARVGAIGDDVARPDHRRLPLCAPSSLEVVGEFVGPRSGRRSRNTTKCPPGRRCRRPSCAPRSTRAPAPTRARAEVHGVDHRFAATPPRPSDGVAAPSERVVGRGRSRLDGSLPSRRTGRAAPVVVIGDQHIAWLRGRRGTSRHQAGHGLATSSRIHRARWYAAATWNHARAVAQHATTRCAASRTATWASPCASSRDRLPATPSVDALLSGGSSRHWPAAPARAGRLRAAGSTASSGTCRRAQHRLVADRRGLERCPATSSATPRCSRRDLLPERPCS